MLSTYHIALYLFQWFAYTLDLYKDLVHLQQHAP